MTLEQHSSRGPGSRWDALDGERDHVPKGNDMSSRQDPGIGCIRDPKHEVAAGVHKAQRHEIGPERHNEDVARRQIPVWWIVVLLS